MPVLRIPLQSSPILALLLALLHLLALFSASVSLEGWPLAVIGVGVCLSATGSIGDALRRWPRSALEIELRDDGGAAWRDRRGAWHEGRSTSPNYVSPWLVIAALAVPGAPRRLLVLTPDAADPEDLRKLRLWLRWRASVPEDVRASQ